MLDLGTKRNAKVQGEVQTELSLIPQSATLLSLISDSTISHFKNSSLTNLLTTSTHYNNSPTRQEGSPTSEEIVKHFSYVMSEKVKKDALEKK